MTNGVADGWRLSPNFVTAGLDAAWLTALTGKLAPASHATALNWLEARLNVKLLLKLVDQSTRRVAELVKAVKSYTYMDQSPMQELDVHEGLESTLTMLGHKLKNVTLVRAYDRSAPRILAHGGELNQVWTNLIDNAIDAVKGSGKICVGTFVEGNQLVVEIVDDGSGIPPEIQPRIFEPFFTTKSVGSGTGLGLIISNRIVADRHGGEIEFESRPGETRFKVRLPVNRAHARFMNETTQFLVRHGPLLVFAAVFLDQMGSAAARRFHGCWRRARFPRPASSASSCGWASPWLASLIADLFWFYLDDTRPSRAGFALPHFVGAGLLRSAHAKYVYPLRPARGGRGKIPPGLSTVVPPLAGMAGVKVSLFLLADGLGALLYGGCFILLGYVFSNQIEQIAAALASIGGSAVGLVVGLGVVSISASNTGSGGGSSWSCAWRGSRWRTAPETGCRGGGCPY